MKLRANKGEGSMCWACGVGEAERQDEVREEHVKKKGNRGDGRQRRGSEDATGSTVEG